MDKKRLDIILFELGFTKSREKAKQAILENKVEVNGRICNKPSELFFMEEDFKVISCDYVGRGAYKLLKAVDFFKLDLTGKVCVDVGASTGGFTQVMLNNGCKKVYAIDVGSDQLDKILREDLRVVSLENTNFRYINSNIFADPIDFISVDVSFISLCYILPKIMEISTFKTEIIVLIKPQFEAGKKYLGKKGVIKDKNVHLQVINNVIVCANRNQLYFNDLTFSPIKGGNGNIEYLGFITRHENVIFENNKAYIIEKIIEEGFNCL